jgi:hypothetical protein
MNRKEFTNALNRIEAAVNKIPDKTLEERVALLGELNPDFQSIRSAGAVGNSLKAAAERLHHAVKDFIRRAAEQQRQAIFTELKDLRILAINIRE